MDRRSVIKNTGIAGVLAIGAMDLVAHAMVEAIPRAIVWSSPLAPNSEGLHIVVPSFFCKADAVQDPNNCLPESWEATSDSIAIRMATVWRIPSLILCKSCGVQGDSLLSPVGPAGFVDPLFINQIPCNPPCQGQPVGGGQTIWIKTCLSRI